MTAQFPHVMLDLETLGLVPGAVVFAIAVVPFNLTVIAPLDQCFYRVINVTSAVRAGLAIDPATLGWWRNQPPEAYEELSHALTMTTGHNLSDLSTALADLTQWYLALTAADSTPTDYPCLWGNGASFDQPLLEAAYRAVGTVEPWPFARHRCFRTLRHLNLPVHEPLFEGTRHHALFDARHQARWAQRLLRGLDLLTNERVE